MNLIQMFMNYIAELIGENFYDSKNENFGLRNIEVNGTQFRV